MSTAYLYKKCRLFGFAQSLDKVPIKDGLIIMDDAFFNNEHAKSDDAILDEFLAGTASDDSSSETVHHDDGDALDHLFTEGFIDKNRQGALNDDDSVPTFVIDLTAKFFGDINILTDEKKEGEPINEGITNGNYRRDDKELSKIASGRSTQLEAFSKNLYTVIYGKKTANIRQGYNNAHIFNHNVIDSLAKNGIICDQCSEKQLSVHKLFDCLERLYRFNIFFIHPSMDLEITECDGPTEISHPIYTKGLGEITAIFYRCLLLRFFPYLTIVSESMRENAYLF